MSVLILGGDFTVYFTDDTNGDKQVKWTGSTGTYTVKELYKAIQDEFDDNTAGVGDNMDEGIPMSAQTPTQYTIGRVETNDSEPWFIDPTSIKHLYGGSLETTGWTRSLPGDGTGAIGIVKVSCTPGTIVDGDVGNAITHADGDAGKLLAVEPDGLWIRPDSNALANDFNSTSGVLTCNGHTSGAQSVAAATGENIWANIYTLGSMADNTDVYVYQNYSKITSWWSTGHIDVLILVKETSALIDDGLLTIFARQYTQLYDHYVADVSAGGRTPIPLATSDDVNNDTGYRTFTGSSGIGTFTALNAIYVGASWAAATAKGILTDVGGTESAPVLTYYLIGDLTDMSSAVYEYDFVTDSRTTYCTAGTPANTGPADLTTDPTFTFGATQQDIGDGDGNEPYDVLVDVQGNTLADFYEFTKYITRRNAGEPLTSAYGHEGEQYVTVGEKRIAYDGQTGAFTEGLVLTGPTGTGVIIADHNNGDNTGTLIVGDVRGTFADNDAITDSSTGAADVFGTPVTTLVSKTAPFGTFAGGRFFGARGVWIENMAGGDVNNYQLIDSNNVTRTPPTAAPVNVHAENSAGTNIEGAQVFIRKSGYYYSYSSDANNDAGDTDFVVNEVVDTDIPQTGWLHVWDASTNTKQNYRFQSWTSKTFTLNATVSGSATSTHGTEPTTHLVSTSTNFLTADIEEGDTIRNTTTGAWAVIDEIVDADNITTSPLSSGQWTSGDGFSLHTLAVNYADNDDLVDIPLFNGQTNASGNTSLSYYGSTPVAVVVRIRSNEGSPKYVPYNTSGTILSTGYSLTAVLTEDSVAT